MSSNPHMRFSGFLVGNLGNISFGAFFIPDMNITLTRVTASENSYGSGCSTTARAQVLLQVGGANYILVDLDLGDQKWFADSGQISVSVSAGSQLKIWGWPADGCTPVIGTSPSDVTVNVQYVMQ